MGLVLRRSRDWGGLELDRALQEGGRKILGMVRPRVGAQAYVDSRHEQARMHAGVCACVYMGKCVRHMHVLHVNM